MFDILFILAKVNDKVWLIRILIYCLHWYSGGEGSLHTSTTAFRSKIGLPIILPVFSTFWASRSGSFQWVQVIRPPDMPFKRLVNANCKTFNHNYETHIGQDLWKRELSTRTLRSIQKVPGTCPQHKFFLAQIA